jgi:predicted phosphate transport protein (TIGR00153 family)
MAFRLIPREEKFYDEFERLASIVLKAAGMLQEATERFETLAENAKRVERLEHDGDQITHDIVARLNRTFITPIDREDIHQLAAALDDVLDLIEETTERFILFKIQAMTPPAAQIAKVIQQQAQEIHLIISKLKDMRHERILEHCIEINRLENAGDRLLREAFASLFDGTPDPLYVIKWRELYELMELATDKCEDVANTVESIVLKNA